MNSISKLRRWLGVISLTVLASLLSACGAVIDTRLVVNEDSSGSRVMTATLPSGQVSSLNGGAAAANQSILNRLPDALSFNGIVEGPGGSLTATFALNFENPQDYIAKAMSILEQVGRGNARVDFIISESPLRSGLEISEDFSSYDLLSWMFEGLIEDGVVSASDRSNSYELGDSLVVFRGQEIQSRSSSISVSLVEDYGFDEISMQTEIVSPSLINRAIRFSVSEKKFEENASRYEEFFNGLTANDVAVVNSASGAWEVSFSGDSKAIANLTDAAFGSSGSTLEVSIAATQESPTSARLQLNQNVNCESVCALGTTVVDVIRGAALSPTELSVNATAGESAIFEVVPPFQAVAATVSFGLFGSVEAQTEFEIRNQYFEFVPQENFEALLRPPAGVGELAITTTENATTILSVTVAGDNFEEFRENFAAWSPGSYFDQVEPEGANIFNQAKSYSFDFGLESLLRTHQVLNFKDLVVTLPLGVSLKTSSNGFEETVQAVDGVLTIPWSGRANFVTSGSLISFLALGLMGVALLALLGVAYLKRTTLRRWYQTAKPRLAGLRLTGLPSASAMTGGRQTLINLLETKSNPSVPTRRLSLLATNAGSPARAPVPRNSLTSLVHIPSFVRSTSSHSLLTHPRTERTKMSFGYLPSDQIHRTKSTHY